MNAKDYKHKYGKAHCEVMCHAVGTSYAYFKHICNRAKRPSVDLARRMVEYSQGEMTLDELLFPKDVMRLPKPLRIAA